MCNHEWESETYIDDEGCTITVFRCKKCPEHYSSRDCGDGPEEEDD